ncbi:interleukin 21 receptor, tandem duplicate 1 [Clarias gariepinus]
MATLYLAIFLLVLCGITQQTGGACDVRCTTDYISTMNCSCSGSEKSLSYEIHTNCSDVMGFTDGRCVIRPPHLWCTIELENFFMIANPDTECTLRAKQVDQQTEWEEEPLKVVTLDQIIMPLQPVNLTLIKNNKDFNLSWEMAYKNYENFDRPDCFIYRVRLRPKVIMIEEDFKVYNISEDCRYQEILCDQLSPGKVYVLDVQARMKDYDFESEWSKWSVGVECICPYTKDQDFTVPFDSLWYFMMLPVVFGLFAFFGIWYRGLFKKPCLFQYIPDPHDFFKPLYHTYQGDFKKWVGPVFTFSSFEVLEKSAPLQVLSEKQQAVTQMQRPLLCDQASGGSNPGEWNLLSLINPALSKRYFLGGSSLGLAHSGGHISMDTVTVSGQEGGMSDFQEVHGNIVDVPDEGENLEPDTRKGSEGQGFDEWQLQPNNEENGEQLSLDSFISNEHSDYGYPQIGLDLDTIDSGFLESDCSSPVSSECEGGERTDTALLGDTAGTHSNYVKQWVAFMPASGENSNSL